MNNNEINLENIYDMYKKLSKMSVGLIFYMIGNKELNAYSIRTEIGYYSDNIIDKNRTIHILRRIMKYPGFIGFWHTSEFNDIILNKPKLLCNIIKDIECYYRLDK